MSRKWFGLLALGALFLGGCDDAPPPAPPPAAVAAAMPLEQQLASINAGVTVASDDIAVARFKSLLRQLDRTFRESPKEIADMSVKAQELLQEKGIRQDLVSIMEGLNTLFPAGKGYRFAEYSAAYVVLRDKGQTHDEAISGLRALVKGLGAS